MIIVIYYGTMNDTTKMDGYPITPPHYFFTD